MPSPNTLNRSRISLIALALICAAFALSAGSARAQGVLRIAAVVNNRVVSVLDVVNRMKFVIWSTGVPNTPENRRRLSAQILRNLIDEELQRQEAERLNITVSDREVDKAFADAAKRNNMTADQLESILRNNGISPEVLRRQIRSQILWGHTVSRRLRREVRVNDEEVDEEIARLEKLRNTPQYHIAEIFLSVDDPDQDERVRQAADRLVQQIKQGADFGALANAFSQSTSAAHGGDIGWVQPGRLDLALDAVLPSLKTGETAGPIRTLAGYYLLKLEGKRQPDGSNSDNAVVELQQIVLPPTDEAGQKALAGDIRAALTSCADLPALIRRIGTKESGSLGKHRIGKLPPALRDAVRDLKAGETSEPIVSATGRTVILMVCNRVEPKEKPLNRSAVRRKLQNSRAERVARRYLRDLRRAAFVDLRG